MLPERIWDFLEHLIYTEKSGGSKIKSTRENLTFMIYGNFILELFNFILALHSYWGDTK